MSRYVRGEDDPVPWTDIIRRCLAGDSKAWDIFYKESWPIIYPIFYWLPKNRQDAEDSCLEFLLRLLDKDGQRLRDYDVRRNSSFRAYLTRLAIHFAIDRSRLREHKDANRWSDWDDYRDTLPSHLAADSFLAEQLVRDAIARLKPKERFIIWMLENGLATKEIARVLKNSPNATYAAVMRARESLRKILDSDAA
ncbi:MAG: RNA polymerase sigma factor [bacterium]